MSSGRQNICSVCGAPLDRDRPRNHWGKCTACHRISNIIKTATYKAKSKPEPKYHQTRIPDQVVAGNLLLARYLKAKAHGGDILPKLIAAFGSPLK